jgi:acyl-CoA thioesterase YciA
MTEIPALPNKHATLRVVPMPRDTNAAGDIFGGWIMSQVDIAGAIAASKRAAGRVVTVAVNAFSFRQPVYVRDVVSFYAEVIRVGTTSLTVDVEVYAERGFLLDKNESAIVKVTEATLTYVAVDAQGHKRPVPPP